MKDDDFKNPLLEYGFTRKDKLKFEDIFKACKYNLTFTHQNAFLLSQFLSPTGQILDQKFTGLSDESYRKIVKAIKRARVLGILPYLNRPTFISPKVLSDDLPGNYHSTKDPN